MIYSRQNKTIDMKLQTLLPSLLVTLALTISFEARSETPKAVIPAEQALATSPRPLMWEITDKDSTVYLFGSIHVLKEGVNWMTPDVRAKFESADDLWLEVPDIDNATAVMQAAQKYMANPANDMAAGLTPEEVAHLNAILTPFNLSSEKLKGLKKWAVGLLLASQQMQALGYNSKLGVDVTFLDGARYLGKRVHGFETLDQQMNFLIPANDAEDIESLREAIKDYDHGEADLKSLTSAWLAGDEEGLAKFLVEKMKNDEPDGYQRLIVQRNTRWEPQIEEILKGKGTVFIAVGAAHLVGPDSVIAQLKSHGIAARLVK